MKTVSSGILLPDADIYLPGGKGGMTAEASADAAPPCHDELVTRRIPREPTEEERRSGIPELVFLPENRLLVRDTRVYPFSAVCGLLIIDRNQKAFYGTGFLAGPRLVITAGHNVYYHGDGFMEKIYVYPGLNGDRNRSIFPAAEARQFYSVEAWVVDENRDFDFGAIMLPTPLGNHAGWFSISRFTAQTLNSLTVSISGYPHTGPVAGQPGATQWRDSSRIDAESNRLRHWADTSIGQSGSPVFAYFPDKPSKYHVVGIHNWGYDAQNVATRINEAVFAQIAAWRAMSEQVG